MAPFRGPKAVERALLLVRVRLKVLEQIGQVDDSDPDAFERLLALAAVVVLGGGNVGLGPPQLLYGIGQLNLGGSGQWLGFGVSLLCGRGSFPVAARGFDAVLFRFEEGLHVLFGIDHGVQAKVRVLKRLREEARGLVE